MVAMSAATSPRLVVAINPRASFGKSRHVGAQVLRAFTDRGCDVERCEASSARELEALVRDALGTPARALVVVGGDGMVHVGAALSREFQVPLAVIPSGTGNDLARHLGIPVDSPMAAVELVVRALEGEPRMIDRAVSTGPDGQETPYLCVLSAGFDAIVNERANSITWPKGRHRYTVALLLELIKLRPRRYRVTIDGVDYSGEYLLVAVANAQSFGGGMKVTPDALIDDGELDVLVVRPLSRIAFLRIYPRVFQGTHVSDPRVSIIRGARVVVDSPDIAAYADGERMGALPVEISVEQQAQAVFA